jgi:mycothiol synthase
LFWVRTHDYLDRVTAPELPIRNVPLRGAAVIESPSGAAMELRWITFGSLADAELLERGPLGAAAGDPAMPEIASSALAEVARDLGAQGVTLRFDCEERSRHRDELARAAAASARLAQTAELIQHRAKVDPDVTAPSVPDDLVVRRVADGEAWEPLARIHEVTTRGLFLRATDTADGLRERLAENHRQPYSVHVVEDPEVVGQFVGMVATAAYRSSPGSPPVGEISLLGVDPDWRRRGLGRALAGHAMAALAADGVRTVMAYVDASNEPGTRLAAGLGFKSRATRTYWTA